MNTFVNPVPGIPIVKWLCFDYPVNYRTRNCLPNLEARFGPEKPAIEDVYGQLGVPAKSQGFPSMREYPYPELEDPNLTPMQDQILDLDRDAVIDHTGRLSGSFVKYLVQDNHKSLVKMHVTSLTGGGNPILIWESGLVALVPVAQAPNVWYWKDPATRAEMVFTAQAHIEKSRWRALNLKPGIYKLIVNWEFWDFKNNGKERMPISGFCEALTFELSAGTVDL